MGFGVIWGSWSHIIYPPSSDLQIQYTDCWSDPLPLWVQVVRACCLGPWDICTWYLVKGFNNSESVPLWNTHQSHYSYRLPTHITSGSENFIQCIYWMMPPQTSCYLLCIRVIILLQLMVGDFMTPLPALSPRILLLSWIFSEYICRS